MANADTTDDGWDGGCLGEAYDELATRGGGASCGVVQVALQMGRGSRDEPEAEAACWRYCCCCCCSARAANLSILF